MADGSSSTSEPGAGNAGGQPAGQAQGEGGGGIFAELLGADGDAAGGQAGGGEAGDKGGEGNGTAPGAGGEWWAKLPAELQTTKIKSFKTVDELAKSHANLETLVGRKGVIVPGKDATAEEQARFKAAIGVPEAPEKYSWKAPDGWSETDKKIEAAARADFHKIGLTDQQYSAVMSRYAEAQQQLATQKQAQDKQELRQTFTALKKEWGEEFEGNIRLAEQTAEALGLTETIRELGLTNKAAAIKAFVKLGQAVQPDTLPGAGGQSGALGLEQQIAAVRKSKEMMDANHPGHAEAVQRLEALYKRRTR